MLAYVVAIAGRTSFGVAGLPAMERFEVDAAYIAVFASAQVAVGALVLIGGGDATAFLSAMRILPFCFPSRWTPLFTQLACSLGQIGQFVSAVPFLALLTARGWTVAFVSLGGVGLLTALVVLIAVAEPPSPTSASVRRRLLTKSLAIPLWHPVTWQAFSIHHSCLVLMLVVTLIWGVPIRRQPPGHRRVGDVLCAAAATQPGTLLAVVILMAITMPTSNYGFDIIRDRGGSDRDRHRHRHG